MLPEALHVAIILSPFVTLPAVGWLGSGRDRARLLALIPAALTGYFTYTFSLVSRSGPFSVTGTWAPALNLSLSFRFDGLSALFAVLITGVGTLIVIYAAKYLEHHPYAGRFHVALFAFMGSMLGLVLSDNVIALFVFWELTGFTSYLLIGFEHERPEARRAATQALLVTGGGGLALLAAGILLLRGRRARRCCPTWSSRGSLVGSSALPRDRCAGAPRGVHEVRAVPVPLLAAERDAGADTGERLPALRDHGEGGRVPRRAHDADPWRHDDLDRHDHDRRRGHDDCRRASRAARDRPQACARVLHDQRAGHSDAAVRNGHTSRRSPLASPICSPMPATRAHCSWWPERSNTRPARETWHRSEDCVGRCRDGARRGPRCRCRWRASRCSAASSPRSSSTTASAMSTLPGIWSGVLVALAVAASMCLGAAGLIAASRRFVAARCRHLRPMMHRRRSGSDRWSSVCWRDPGHSPGTRGRPNRSRGGLGHRNRYPAPRFALWHGFTITLVAERADPRWFGRPVHVSRTRLWRLRMAARTAGTSVSTRARSPGSMRSAAAIAPALQSASLRSYVLTVVVTAIALVGTALAADRPLPPPRRWTPIEFHEGCLPRSSSPARCRPRSHARAWPPSCRSVRSATGSP